jgi:hypothetical protein
MIGIHNRYLPLWVHRVCNGFLGAVASATLASVGMSRFAPDHLLHQLSVILLYLSLPIGVLLAVVARRWSIVEGCAGEVGYDDLLPDCTSKEKTYPGDEPNAGTTPRRLS